MKQPSHDWKDEHDGFYYCQSCYKRIPTQGDYIPFDCEPAVYPKVVIKEEIKPSCESCKHWVTPSWNTADFGTCYSRKENKKPIFKIISNGDINSLATHKTFCCNVYEAKEVEDKP